MVPGRARGRRPAPGRRPLRLVPRAALPRPAATSRARPPGCRRPAPAPAGTSRTSTTRSPRSTSAGRSGPPTSRGATPSTRPARGATGRRSGLWLLARRGVAGFRVDMAFSLVKDDPGKAETVALWRELRAWLDAAHPDAVLIPEGREPRTGGPLAFHADFFLVIHAAHASLFDNGYAGTLPWQPQLRAVLRRRGRGQHRGVPRRLGGGQGARPGAAGAAVHRRPRLRPAALRPARARAARRRADLPVHLGQRAVPLLRRRDRHALPARDARRRGRRLQPRVQPGGLPHADAVGRRAERRLLHGRPGPAVPAGRPGPGPADRGRPARRPELHAAPRARAHRPAEGHARARRPRPTRRWCTRATRSPTCGAGSHLVVVNPREERASVEVSGAKGATVLFGQGVTIEGNDVTVDGFGYAVLALA